MLRQFDMKLTFIIGSNQSDLLHEEDLWRLQDRIRREVIRVTSSLPSPGDAGYLLDEDNIPFGNWSASKC